MGSGEGESRRAQAPPARFYPTPGRVRQCACAGVPRQEAAELPPAGAGNAGPGTRPSVRLRRGWRRDGRGGAAAAPTAAPWHPRPGAPPRLGGRACCPLFGPCLRQHLLSVLCLCGRTEARGGAVPGVRRPPGGLTARRLGRGLCGRGPSRLGPAPSSWEQPGCCAGGGQRGPKEVPCAPPPARQAKRGKGGFGRGPGSGGAGPRVGMLPLTALNRYLWKRHPEAIADAGAEVPERGSLSYPGSASLSSFRFLLIHFFPSTLGLGASSPRLAFLRQRGHSPDAGGEGGSRLLLPPAGAEAPGGALPGSG